MENIAEFFTSYGLWIGLFALEIIASVALIISLKFFAKQRTVKLSAIWYVGAWFAPVITAIVFLVKRKKFPKINEKVCPCCGNRYPEIYQLCSTCLIDLDEIDYDKKKKQGTLSKIFFVLFALLYIAANVISFVFVEELGESLTDGLFGSLFDSSRIALVDENGKEVYYDKKGNVYTDGYDVLLYGEDGEVYTYTEEEEYDEEYEMSFPAYYYVDSKGEKYDTYYCYVDENGWFKYDGEGTFEWDSAYNEELYPEGSEDVYYEEMIDEDYVYKFYNDRYLDKEGNIYYFADDASWNADGELITAENDPTLETE